ncbi:PTS sugar transporter subunit IIA [Enterococcus sp. AZ109]|uniref:PTS sugar transporter subunit IIA n=1 Tax=Enterococcus sp. AZ109 TaxID=2774634 RepID=UPI003F22D451
MLEEILTEALIDLNFPAATREEAMTRSGELLVENNLATPDYIRGMLKNVEENGTYIVIAPGIALPHARPEEGALAPGISIVTLKEPVVFGHPQNDPVKLVIGLCATDQETHLDALVALVELLAQEGMLERFVLAERTEDIMEIIKGGNGK